MPTYVAFLRAINLGATRTFGKDAVRAAVEGAGCTDVETYLNTGNVRLRSSLRSTAKVEALLEEAFAADRGFEVPTIVFTPAELREIAERGAAYEAARGVSGGSGRHYVELLRDPPPADLVATLEAGTDVGDDGNVARVGGRALHLMVASDYAGAALLRKAVEKQLGVTTNRNLAVVTELARRWG